MCKTLVFAIKYCSFSSYEELVFEINYSTFKKCSTDSIYFFFFVVYFFIFDALGGDKFVCN